MKKKGFTLIEILAVIIILALLSGIATLTAGRILKNSRKKEAIKQEEILTSLGETIYTHERISGGSTSVFKNKVKNNESFYIEINDLKKAGYLEGDIENPNGDGVCDGTLEYKDKEFKGYISCPNVYEKTLPKNGDKLEWNVDHWEE